MNHPFIALFVSVMIMDCIVSPAHGLDIVRDGKPAATVVIRPSQQIKHRPGWPRISADEWAAGIIVEWIEKITGAELPVSDKAPEGSPTIYVGKAALEAGLKLNDIQSPSQEGLRIVTNDRRILIAGQNEISTVKAACRFLEELGCRYFVDHPIGEVYPRTKTLTVDRGDITEKPGFVHRRIWGSGWTKDTLWKIWNGAGGLQLNTGHAWGRYVSTDLFTEHPEYFTLRNGKRLPGEWYCTSNPGLREVFTDGVIAHIKGGDTHPSLSPPDGIQYCRSEACKAQDDPRSLEPSSGHVSMTNRYLDFYQDVAARVARGSPDSILSFYCYADYTQPPTSGIKLEPNLCAWLTPIRYCRYHRIGHPHCPSRRQLGEVIDGWSRSAEKIAYRTYNYNLAECLVPYSKISIWKHDIPYLKREGCIAISLETLANWQIYGPHIYLSIRLAYDPRADADMVMDDYFLKFYGPNAGPTMKAYWMAIDSAFDSLKCHSGSFYALHLVYAEGFLKHCQALLNKARAAVRSNQAYAQRVEMAAEGFKNAVQYIQLREAMNRGDFALASQIYDDLLHRSKSHSKKGLGTRYTVRYLERFIGKPIDAAAKATSPPNRIIQVLPDQWRLKYDPYDTGIRKGYNKTAFDDSQWPLVATYSNTLDAQGLPDRKTIMWYRAAFHLPSATPTPSLLFVEIDGKATVYVNGKKTGESLKTRQPFEVDIADAAVAGLNVLAVRVDHSRISELFLGGIIRPVLLIKKEN